MAEQHAQLGASSAHRWMNCPGSVALMADVEPQYLDQVSEYALEGTAAHVLGEMCLTKRQHPHMFINMQVSGFIVDNDMTEAVEEYVRHCFKLIETADTYWIEKRFSLDALNPPQKMFGTADFVAFVPPVLHVVDYKHGKGVSVDVIDNPQMQYYGLGAALDVEKQIGTGLIEEVLVTIVQPRAPHSDGSVRTWALDYLDVVEFGAHLLDMARIALSEGAPRVTGAHCRWCRAAGICPEIASRSLEVAKQEFGQKITGPVDPKLMTPEQIADVLDNVHLLESWISDLREYAKHLLKTGQEVPGYKIVEKFGNRKWKEEQAVKEWAAGLGYERDDICTKPKLCSVAQLEKVVGKGSIPEELIERPRKEAMVPESDKRPALKSAKEEFENE